jgi:hypothetical protein
MKHSATFMTRWLIVFAVSLWCCGCASVHTSSSRFNKEASNVVSDKQINEKLEDVIKTLRDLEEMRATGFGPQPQRAEVQESFLKDPTRKKDAQALLESADRYLSDLGKERQAYSDVKVIDWFP